MPKRISVRMQKNGTGYEVVCPGKKTRTFRLKKDAEAYKNRVVKRKMEK
jgi:hypothetical protein